MVTKQKKGIIYILIRCLFEETLLEKQRNVVLPFPSSLLSPQFKKILKNKALRSKLSLDLIYGLSFQIQVAYYFPPSLIKKTGLIFYSVDFHGRNWRIPSFYENKTQPTKVGFIFIGLNSLSLAEDLAAVNHVTQAVVRVESKIGSKSRV